MATTRIDTIRRFFKNIPIDAPITKCKDKSIMYVCASILGDNVLSVDANIDRFKLFVRNLNIAAQLNVQESDYKYITHIDNSAKHIFVFGDIHGDYGTMIKIESIINKNINDKSNHFIFLGDYVDRGIRNLDVLFELSSLKTTYPQQIHLLRGNHESIDSYLVCDMSKGNLLKAINIQSIPIEGKIEVMCSVANFFSSLPYVFRFKDCVFAHGEVASFDENATYEPRVSVLDYEPPKTLELLTVWGDYPNESRSKTTSYTSKADFVQRLTNAGVHHYVKGHNHTANNTAVLITNTDINYYIVISSLMDDIQQTSEHTTYDKNLNEVEELGSTYSAYMLFEVGDVVSASMHSLKEMCD